MNRLSLKYFSLVMGIVGLVGCGKSQAPKQVLPAVNETLKSGPTPGANANSNGTSGTGATPTPTPAPKSGSTSVYVASAPTDLALEIVRGIPLCGQVYEGRLGVTIQNMAYDSSEASVSFAGRCSNPIVFADSQTTIVNGYDPCNPLLGGSNNCTSSGFGKIRVYACYAKLDPNRGFNVMLSGSMFAYYGNPSPYYIDYRATCNPSGAPQCATLGMPVVPGGFRPITLKGVVKVSYYLGAKESAKSGEIPIPLGCNSPTLKTQYLPIPTWTADDAVSCNSASTIQKIESRPRVFIISYSSVYPIGSPTLTSTLQTDSIAYEVTCH